MLRKRLQLRSTHGWEPRKLRSLIYAPIAQWIEQRFSKPEVESSSLSGGTNVRAARLEEQQLAKLEVGGSTPLADANDLVA